ncbi:hypothetical protein Pint_07365 [Pistacia integerrima]|uniref:Uncharacterized protein n=1 Tax=Pistacia integerrima TaxID=434235 RepID=A0ACC0XX73_9ROSI|nr:hypothetical protein Pint_07365 [Pistacia integerrima]
MRNFWIFRFQKQYLFLSRIRGQGYSRNSTFKTKNCNSNDQNNYKLY